MEVNQREGDAYCIGQFLSLGIGSKLRGMTPRCRGAGSPDGLWMLQPSSRTRRGLREVYVPFLIDMTAPDQRGKAYTEQRRFFKWDGRSSNC